VRLPIPPRSRVDERDRLLPWRIAVKVRLSVSRLLSARSSWQGV
jgi:hypothetical protein